MRSKISIVLAVFVAVMILAAGSLMLNGADKKPLATSTRAVPIVPHWQAGVHDVRPTPGAVERMVIRDRHLKGAPQETIDAAVAEYNAAMLKQSREWVNPQVQLRAEQRERDFANGRVKRTAIQPVSINIFYLAVDFGGTDTYTPAGSTAGPVTRSGPLKGQIPAPEAGDNWTLWYSPAQTANATFYENLMFGTAGIGRARMDLTDPDDNQAGINLAGLTMQTYYDQLAGAGNVSITGRVAGWVTVPHSEGYYGEDIWSGSAPGSSHHNGGPVLERQLVVDALEVFKAANPGFDFRPYDQNDDGVLDTIGIIHAGVGQEAGGESWTIWAHSSNASALHYKVWEDGIAGDTAGDIWLGPYTMQPETLDLGVLCEEFGHNYFGLPDMYATDVTNSVGFWNIMSQGSWGGWLGGSMPSGMPLWFRMIAQTSAGFTNWHEPMTVHNYDDAAATVTIGQLESTPAGVSKGVAINLPDFAGTSYANRAGSGKEAFTLPGTNNIDITLSRSLTLGAGAHTLTIPSWYSIEEGWDYAYVEINGTKLDDTGAYCTTDDPNDQNLGNGITGASGGLVNLVFDLSAYANQTVTLTLRYVADAYTTEEGWHVDNIALDGTVIEDFETATTSLPTAWTNSSPGWVVAPYVVTYPQYYLLEWRNATLFDRTLKIGMYYTQAWAGDYGYVMGHIPYNIPGALLYYRNTKFVKKSTYTQSTFYTEAPSYGPKMQLLVVDPNYWPFRLNKDYTTSYNANVGSYDAALTLNPAPAFVMPSVAGLTSPPAPYAIAARPAITQFNDNKGYYAGLYYTGTGYSYANQQGSAVIPGNGGTYSERISDSNFYPLTALYGAGFTGHPSPVGSGNPGDQGRANGVCIDLLSQSANGDRGTLKIYNSSASIDVKRPTLRTKWAAGSTQDIQWTTTGAITAVNIEFSSDSGVTWTTVANNVPSTSGSGSATVNPTYITINSYSWTVPTVNSINCVVRIKDAGTSGALGQSSESFTIPLFKVIAPNGGVALQVGAPYSITWLATGMTGNVSVELLKAGVKVADLGSAPAQRGFINWTVPLGQTLGADYLVRIRLDELWDDSDARFSIVAASTTALGLNRDTLNFGAVSGRTSTATETVQLTNVGTTGTLSWTATPSVSWITVNPASGSGNAIVGVSVDPTGLAVGTHYGSVAFADPAAGNSPLLLAVILKVTAAGSKPIGSLETPIHKTSGVTGEVPVTGWALDDVEVTGVKIYRDRMNDTEPCDRNGLVFIGDATFVEGARPDVETAYPEMPFSYRAGYGYMMLSNTLPHGGNGQYVLHAIATDREGNQVELGEKTITCDNLHAIYPFGTIDTPTQGGTVSGIVNNFGWALSPLPGGIATDGSTIWAWVDGVPLGHPIYNVLRPDVAQIFPGLTNTNGAGGLFVFDSTTLINGTHTIAWSVENSLGRNQGVGSRYFQVLNSGVTAKLVAGNAALTVGKAETLNLTGRSLRARLGFGKTPVELEPASDGVLRVDLRECQPLMVQLGDEQGADAAFDETFVGWQVVNGERRALPIGSNLNPKTGTFSWIPGPGFLGEFTFVFQRNQGGFAAETHQLMVKIGPKLGGLEAE